MALKFLNKKGWHTGSLRNIENVWKAEQKRDAEERKLDELRKQIVEERERSEFRALQEQAGLVPKQERLEFLYDSGLSVGRPSGSDNFKALEEPPSSSSAAAPAPKEESPSSSVPGALFSAAEKPQSANDAWRKLHSDPLLMIKQREQEALARIKNNPVQMARIRQQVEAKQPTEKVRDKKEHRKKHRKDSSKHRRQTSDSENDTAEMEKSGRHHKVSKHVKHSESEDESHKKPRRSESRISDSEDESRNRARRGEKNYVKLSSVEDETRYRERQSRRNHDKYSEDEDELYEKARRSEKDHVKHSDLESATRNRPHRSEKNRAKRSDSEDELHKRGRRSEKNRAKHSDSEDELHKRGRPSEKKNRAKHTDSEDEMHKRGRPNEKNHVKDSDLESERPNRGHQSEKDYATKSAKGHQVTVKEKQDNSKKEGYSTRGRNEAPFKRRFVPPKLSEEERAARLKEMQMDAELHEEQRWKRLKKADESDAREATQADRSGGRNFLDAVHTSVYGAGKGGSSTIEESVRRRTHYSQGKFEAGESNAFRR